MNLAAIYSVWNGLELLGGSIDQIYDDVDHIIIVWQWQSNWFVDNPNLDKELEVIRLKDVDKKMIFVEFTPQRTDPKANEVNKHNLGIDHARSIGASHFFLSGCDHYYNQREFVKAKEEILKQGYGCTATGMYTYYKQPDWRLSKIEPYYMPFICEATERTRIVPTRFPVRVDPACCVNPTMHFYLFKEYEIMMHHYSMVRKDIRNKFENAASKHNWRDKMESFIEEYENYDIKSNPGVSYFQGITLEEVENEFNIYF